MLFRTLRRRVPDTRRPPPPHARPQLAAGVAPEAAAAQLCDACCAPDTRGSGLGCDNMSVVVCAFKPTACAHRGGWGVGGGCCFCSDNVRRRSLQTPLPLLSPSSLSSRQSRSNAQARERGRGRAAPLRRAAGRAGRGRARALPHPPPTPPPTRCPLVYVARGTPPPRARFKTAFSPTAHAHARTQRSSARAHNRAPFPPHAAASAAATRRCAPSPPSPPPHSSPLDDGPPAA